MTFQIQTSDQQSIPHRNRYPLEEMRVGDCLFIEDYKVAQSARVAAIQFVKRRNLDWRFSIRKMRDGWRIFRIC